MAHFSVPLEKYVPQQIPEVYNLTWDEAVHDVQKWRTYADTVGGDACVVDEKGEVYSIPNKDEDVFLAYPEKYGAN